MAGLVSVGTVAGCDRNIEAYQPGEQPSDPDLARIFPAPPGGVGSAAGADGGGANVGEAGDGAGTRGNTGAATAGAQAARQALPPSRAEALAGGGVGSASAAAPILGRIDIAPEWAGRSPAGAILFVIARNSGARGGPPLAVLRIADPQFPLDFSIGPENVMIPSMQFAGSISLSARLDADGNAMTRGAGDVSSPTIDSLAPGATGVEIVLSIVLSEGS